LIAQEGLVEAASQRVEAFIRKSGKAMVAAKAKVGLENVPDPAVLPQPEFRENSRICSSFLPNRLELPPLAGP